ncbi:MAG: hypothetical protein HY719_10115 [Planctomycetes bacterium]|nr:hypothetical protein [Planctomycetota bacterium]
MKRARVTALALAAAELGQADLAAWLRRLRDVKHLTARHIARLAGCSPQTVCNWGEQCGVEFHRDHAVRRARELATRGGFASLADYFAAHAGETVHQQAAGLSVSRSTVKRLRLRVARGVGAADDRR